MRVVTEKLPIGETVTYVGERADVIEADILGIRTVYVEHHDKSFPGRATVSPDGKEILVSFDGIPFGPDEWGNLRRSVDDIFAVFEEYRKEKDA